MCTYYIRGQLSKDGDMISKSFIAGDRTEAIIKLAELVGVKPDHKGLHRRVRRKILGRIRRELAAKFGHIKLFCGRTQIWPQLKEREITPKRTGKNRGRYRNRPTHRHGWALPHAA